ncbi:hypothetical protein C0991_012226 [Blastosporella zonata]|nr:hypothetical protein C0991_012226 [Blastosporella zonata]
MHKDRLDDIKAGNHSTAVLFGDYVRPILALFATAFVVTIAYAGILNNQGPLYHLVTVGGTATHLLWQLSTLKPEVPLDCWQKFKVRLQESGIKRAFDDLINCLLQANGDLGCIAFAGIAADYFMKI